ncbi:MAG: T9SS type A sorting domain-containing protein [Candidatus Micrarchaeia archaeon]
MFVTQISPYYNPNIYSKKQQNDEVLSYIPRYPASILQPGNNCHTAEIKQINGGEIDIIDEKLTNGRLLLINFKASSPIGTPLKTKLNYNEIGPFHSSGDFNIFVFKPDGTILAGNAEESLTSLTVVNAKNRKLFVYDEPMFVSYGQSSQCVVLTTENKHFELEPEYGGTTYANQLMVNPITGDTKYRVGNSDSWKSGTLKAVVENAGEETSVIESSSVSSLIGLLAPNPVTKGRATLTVDLPEQHAHEPFSIKVYTPNGRVVYEQLDMQGRSEISLNLSDLSSGTYYANIYLKNGFQTTIPFEVVK